jgi:hypothetical protein
MKEAFPRVLFALALMGVAFGYGFVSHWKEIFPYQILRQGHLAFEALLELGDEDLNMVNILFWDESGISGPTYRTLAPNAGSEKLFIVGSSRAYRNGAGGDAYLAWIANRDGNIVHAWKDPGELWSPLVDRDAAGERWESYPVGAHLYPNGDILVSYQAYNTFPISMGLAKFDKDSRLVWKTNGFYHHWFSVAPNGDIYVPNTLVGTSPMQIPEHRKTIVCSDERFPYDSIVVLDSDGNRKKEIDLFAAFVNSGLAGVFNSITSDLEEIHTCDPMHLNDIRILSHEMSAEFPEFSPGDLLLSFRSLNGVGVLDPHTGLFKWFHGGASNRQHSPRFYQGNRVLMFDNYGNRSSLGTTRVLAVDVGSGETETIFPRPGTKAPDRTFFSKSGGHLDLTRTGDRMLTTFSRQGFAWEIDTATGDVLWEYVNTHTVDGRPARVDLFLVKYADEPRFELNHGQLGRQDH